MPLFVACDLLSFSHQKGAAFSLRRLDRSGYQNDDRSAMERCFLKGRGFPERNLSSKVVEQTNLPASFLQ